MITINLAPDPLTYKDRYYRENREKIRVKQRAYYLANQERIKTRSEAYRQANRAERDAYNRQYKRLNRDSVLETQRRCSRGRPSGDRRVQYGIRDAHRFDEVFHHQGRKCAICLKSGEAVKWHADHDHSTGYLRGVLCPQCNVGLGMYADTPERLRAAADYLENPPAAEGRE